MDAGQRGGGLLGNGARALAYRAVEDAKRARTRRSVESFEESERT